MQRSTAGITGLEESTDSQSVAPKASAAQSREERLAESEDILLSATFRNDEDSECKKIFPKVIAEVDISTMSTDLKIFHKRHPGYLINAVTERNIEKLKFFLWPSFTSIRNRDWNEEYPKSEWAFFNVKLQFEFYSKLFEILAIWTPLLQNEMIISYRQDNDIKRSEQKMLSDKFKKKFFELVESHGKAKKKIKSHGIEDYNEWTQKNISTIQTCRRGHFLGSEAKELLIEDQNIELKSVQHEIINLMNLFVLPHVEEQTKELFDAKDDFDLSSHVKSSCEKFLENLISKVSNLQILKANIKLKQNEFNIEVEYDALSKNAMCKVTTYEAEKLKIEETYKQSAIDWVKKHEEDDDVFDSLWGDKNGWNGAQSPEMLVDWIIEYKSFANTSRSPNQTIKNIFSEIEKIEGTDMRSQFMASMEEHWNSSRLERVTEGYAVTEVNARRNKHKTLLSGEFPQDIIDGLQKYEPQCWLKIPIPDPLEWPKLVWLLEALPCHSEIQLILKKELLGYLKNKTMPIGTVGYIASFITSLPRFDMTLNRRREAEYIISSLYLASEKRQDKGILYDVSAEGFSTGVTYILELIPAEIYRSSDLQTKLTAFMKKISDCVPMLGNIELKELSSPSANETPKEKKRKENQKESKNQQASPLFGKKAIGGGSVVMFGIFYPKTPNPNIMKKFHDVVLVKPPEKAEEKAAIDHPTHSTYFRSASRYDDWLSEGGHVHSIHC